MGIFTYPKRKFSTSFSISCILEVINSVLWCHKLSSHISFLNIEYYHILAELFFFFNFYFKTASIFNEKCLFYSVLTKMVQILIFIIRNNRPSWGNHLNVSWFWVIFRVLLKSPFWLTGILTTEWLVHQIRRISRHSTQSMDKACSYVQQMYVGVTNPHTTSIPQHMFNRTHVEAFMQSRVWTYDAFSNNIHKAFSPLGFWIHCWKADMIEIDKICPQWTTIRAQRKQCALCLYFSQRFAV